MAMNDLINGLFEYVGACMCWFNVMKLRNDKCIHGVLLSTQVFFTAWGWWNCFYYPSLNQVISWGGAILMAAANTVWIMLALRYRYLDGRLRIARLYGDTPKVSRYDNDLAAVLDTTYELVLRKGYLEGNPEDTLRYIGINSRKGSCPVCGAAEGVECNVDARRSGKVECLMGGVVHKERIDNAINAS